MLILLRSFFRTMGPIFLKVLTSLCDSLPDMMMILGSAAAFVLVWCLLWT